MSRRRGSITTNGGKFYAVVDLGRGETGKRQRHWSKGFETRDDAEDALIELLHTINEGDSIVTSKMPLGRFLEERWLPIISPELSPSTEDNYGAIIRGHIGGDPIADERLDQIDPTKLDAVRLRKRGGKKHQGLAEKTIADVHALLSSAFAFAVNKGLLTKNPARLAKRPKGDEDPDTPTPWSAAEVRAFLEYVSDDRLEALWWMLATTGMRRSEVLGIGWANVDVQAGSVGITHAVVKGPEGVVRQRRTKTKSSKRRVALDGQSVAKLRTWLGTRNAPTEW